MIVHRGYDVRVAGSHGHRIAASPRIAGGDRVVPLFLKLLEKGENRNPDRDHRVQRLVRFLDDGGIDMVESMTGAVALGAEGSRFRAAFAAPVPQFGPWLRFQSPLVKPSMQIVRIRLSLVPSNLRSRQAGDVT
jgi:hypothetical protein